jgi:malonate-semialdehyde dehydrogenase (acetylating)/methylmalonate-semialdehyde dehydrogenase
MTEIIDHWINGASATGVSTRTAPVYNPATGAVQREVRLATVGDVDVAVAAAKAALPAWSGASWSKRQTVMFAFRELLNARKGEVAAILTNEHGKVTSDALGEVARGLEVVEFATSMPHLAKGEYSDNVSTGVDV